MQKQVMITKRICDFCKKEETYDKCLSCGKDICYKCQKTEAKIYQFALNFKGSEDGIYCNDCDTKLKNQIDSSDIKSQHTSYLILKNLADKYNCLLDKLKLESDEAESTIKYWNNKLKRNR
jgi:hypothetical protein